MTCWLQLVSTTYYTRTWIRVLREFDTQIKLLYFWARWIAFRDVGIEGTAASTAVFTVSTTSDQIFQKISNLTNNQHFHSQVYFYLIFSGTTWYSSVFWVADNYKSKARKSKFKMVDPKWLPCCNIISMKLGVVSMEYIFIHAKKDVITEKNDGVKN